MKRNYLLLASLILLTGCQENEVFSSVESSKELASTSSNSEVESSSKEVSSTNESSTIESSSEASSSVEESTSKDKVEQLEISFTGLTDKSSIDLANSKNNTAIEAFENSFGKVLKSATYYKVFLETCGFRMASQSDTGELVLNLNTNEYTNIDVHAKAYSKYDDYNKLWRTDTDAKFKVNGTEFSCISTSGVESEYNTFTYNQKDAFTKITIETVSARLIIDKITLY